jgi:hypothetical protein
LTFLLNFFDEVGAEGAGKELEPLSQLLGIAEILGAASGFLIANQRIASTDQCGSA